MHSARTFLFVPGNRPERFDKAVASGADMVIVDLEDPVPESEKILARAAVADWLCPDRQVVLRINGAGTSWFEGDLALAEHPAVAAVVFPKAEPGSALSRVARMSPVLALIEIAAGALKVAAIAATPGVRRLAIGTIDLALDVALSGQMPFSTPSG